MAGQFNLFVPNSDRASGNITRGLESAAYHAAPPITGMASPSAMFDILSNTFQNVGKIGGDILKNLQFQKNTEVQNNINDKQLQFQKNVYNENNPTKYTTELNNYKQQTTQSILDNTWLDTTTKQKMLNNVDLFTSSHEEKINQLTKQNIRANLISSFEGMSGQISLMDNKQSENIYKQNLDLLQTTKDQGHISESEYTQYKDKLNHSFDYTQLDKTYIDAMRVSMQSNSTNQLIKFRNSLLANDKDGNPINYKSITEQERLHKVLSIDQSMQRVQAKAGQDAFQSQKSTVNLYSNLNNDIASIRNSKEIPNEQKVIISDAISSVQNDLVKDPIKTIQEFYPIAQNPSQYIMDSPDGSPYIAPEFAFKIQAIQGITQPSVLSKDEAIQYKAQLATQNPEQKKQFFNFLRDKYGRYIDYVSEDLKKSDINVIDQLALSNDDPVLQNELINLSEFYKNKQSEPVKISHFFGKDTLATPEDIKNRKKKAKSEFIDSSYGKYLFNYDKNNYNRMVEFSEYLAASPLYNNEKSISKYFDHINVIEENNMTFATDMKPEYVKKTLNDATTNISKQIGLPKEYTNIVEWRQDGDNHFTMFLNYAGDLHKIATIPVARGADNAKQLDLNNIQYSSNIFNPYKTYKKTKATMEKENILLGDEPKIQTVDVNDFLMNDLK